jgi:hypothetical protein
MSAARLTTRERALCEVIDSLIRHVEALGCTCATNDQINRNHTAAGRRRRDSACTGVALAVTADLARRRALRRRDPPGS